MQGFNLTVSSAGGDFELPAAGSHSARVVAVINGGTRVTAGIGGQPSRRVVKLLLGLELPHERRADGRPAVVLFEVTASLHPKATLRKLVEQVLGRQLAEGECLPITDLLNQPCSVAITHEVRADRTFYRVASIGPPIRGMAVPDATYGPLAWSIDGGTPFPAPDWLPFHFGRSVADWVAESEEAGQVARSIPSTSPPAGVAVAGAEADIAY